MAFNPFHSFRKHKKVIFAGLTIMCMVTFVLAGNMRGADPFDWIISKFGGASNKRGDIVTTLYGEKIYSGQIDERMRQRQLANDFARGVVSIGIANVNKKVDELNKKPEDFEAKPAEGSELRNAARSLTMIPQLMNHPQFRSMVPGQLANLQESLQTMRGTLARKGREDEAQVADGMLIFARFQLWLLASADAGNAWIFGGSNKRQDILDFMVWLKQADSLGIKFTEADIRANINRLSPLEPVLTGKKSDDVKTLASMFNQKQADAIDLPTLYQALGDELRVSLAKGIILGEEPGFFRAKSVPDNFGRVHSPFREPTGVTPGEYVDYYRKQVQRTDVALLPVPVSAFVSSKDIPEPTARQIEELFDLYSNYEPRPFSATPGFKIPQKVRVQWVSDAKVKKETFEEASKLIPMGGWLATAEDPREKHYHQRASKHLALLLAGSPAHATAPGLLPQGVLLALELHASAARDVRAYYPQPSLLQADPTAAYHTAAAMSPEMAARFAGLTLGGSATYGDSFIPSVAATIWMQAASSEKASKQASESLKVELTKRAQILAGLIANSTTPALVRPGVWYWADSQHEVFADTNGVLPHGKRIFEAMVPTELLKERIHEKLVRDVASSQEAEDLTDFTKKLAEAKSDAEKAKKVIAEFTTRMRLQNTSGESQVDDDRWTLKKDPGLAPLERAYRSYVQEQNARILDPDLAIDVFDGSPLYAPSQIREGEKRPMFIFWKTMNDGARSARLNEVVNRDTGETARDQVIKAWRGMEARKIARKKAEEIAKQVEGKSEKEALKIFEDVLKSQTGWGYVLRYSDLGRLKKTDSNVAAEKFRYSEYRIPENEIAYPGTTFIDDLLKIEEHKTDVLKDRPEAMYYVAYAVKRPEMPSVQEAIAEDNRKKLLPSLNAQEREEAQTAIVEELRREAAGKQGLDARGRFVINPKVKKEVSEAAE